MTRRGQGPLIVTGNPDPDVQRKLLPAARLIVQTQPRYAHLRLNSLSASLEISDVPTANQIRLY